MKYLAFFLTAAGALAAVDGTVVNRTTGKPAQNATVSLFKIGQAGPEMLDSVKSDAQGKFKFDRALEPGPHNVQTAFQGVTYNHILPPGTPSEGIQIEVFDASKTRGQAKVAQHMLLLEPAGGQLGISETYFYKNDGNVTYNDPDNGTLRFYVPDGAQNLQVRAAAPNGMPIERAPDRTDKAGVYKLDWAIRPGETRIDINYSVPLATPATFSSKMFYKGTPTRLAVPSGVTLQGDGLQPLGQEPQTQAAIYQVDKPEFTFTIQGTGSLQPAAADSGGDAGPQISQINPPQFDDRRNTILALTLVALALGFALLYRKGQPADGGRKG